MKRNDKHELKGIYDDSAAGQTVYLDGVELDPGPSQKFHNHSPDGFSWGYTGSGPSQLALAVVLAITGKADGYQQFKFDVIAKLPQEKDFEIKFTIEGGKI